VSGRKYRKLTPYTITRCDLIVWTTWLFVPTHNLRVSGHGNTILLDRFSNDNWINNWIDRAYKNEIVIFPFLQSSTRGCGAIVVSSKPSAPPRVHNTVYTTARGPTVSTDVILKVSSPPISDGDANLTRVPTDKTSNSLGTPKYDFVFFSFHSRRRASPGHARTYSFPPFFVTSHFEERFQTHARMRVFRRVR